MQYKESDLFERLADLEAQKLVLSEDIKQLKKDFTFNKKDNPSGIEKGEVKKVASAAKLHAKNDFEEKREAATEVFQKYVELTNYE
ncbi:hypothetical protein D3C78_1264860 [compost metagenome]